MHGDSSTKVRAAVFPLKSSPPLELQQICKPGFMEWHELCIVVIYPRIRPESSKGSPERNASRIYSGSYRQIKKIYLGPSEPGFLFIGHCAVVAGVCPLALHACKSLTAHFQPHTGASSHPHVVNDTLYSWGLRSSLKPLIGWPQSADMWLCLGACWLTVSPSCPPARMEVPESHRIKRFALLFLVTWAGNCFREQSLYPPVIRKHEHKII